VQRNQLEAQLDEAGIDLSGALHDLETAQRELTAVKAQLANATAVSAPAGRRDVATDDQPTVPVPLWRAPITGPVVPVRGPAA
jgi:hypothetical protein